MKVPQFSTTSIGKAVVQWAAQGCGMLNAPCLVAAAVLIVPAGILRAAETSAQVNSISVFATVSAVSNLTTNILNISDNGTAANIAFGNITGAGSWSNISQQYVQVTVQDNAASWRLRIYTDNYTAAPSTAVWGFQYGGLKGVANGAKVAMGWQCKAAVVSGGVSAGDPAVSTANGWMFVKDIHDADDPSTASDEGFASADLGGYTNIAFGSPSYTRVVMPTAAGGNQALATPASPFYLYTEGDFSSAPATTYSGTVKLELLNQ